MKRTLLRTLAAALLLLAAMVGKAQTVVLSESFEAGIPTTWTQEHVKGSQDWTVESGTGLMYPTGAFSGEKRAVLRNGTSQTLKYKTRLITPMMDLSSVYQPILRFAHAQPRWSGDFDTLRVYYRTAENADWVQLVEYATALPSWKWETISLIAPNATYQLAFEGTDNLGYGIALDSIMVRSQIICTQPYDLSVSNMIADRATLNWNASFDAEEFAVKVSPVQITENNFVNDSVSVVDTIVSSNQFSVSVAGLKSRTSYYYYVKSNCETDESDWTEGFFTMSARELVPYVQHFDTTEITDIVITGIRGWTRGSNVVSSDNTIYPHINSNNNSTERTSYSPNGTSALCFTGAYSSSSVISAGYYMYMATPEIVAPNFQDVEVSFTGTVSTYCPITYARSLIVGVMTDPSDVLTFVPVDTVTVTERNTFEEFVVSMQSYTGEGRYIAFVSNFDKPNIFFMDELTINTAPACLRPMNLFGAAAAKSATFSWNERGTAANWQLVVSKSPIDDFDALASNTDVVYSETVTTNPVTVSGLDSIITYYAYVRSLCGSSTSEWSPVAAFRTAYPATLPMSFGFEPSEGAHSIEGYSDTYPNRVAVYSNYSTIPHIYSTATNVHSGSNSLNFISLANYYAYAVFPSVGDTIDMTKLRMSFYSKYSTAYTFEVGVMDASNDFSSFVKVAEVTTQSDWTRSFIAFTNYTGTGRYIAIRAKDFKTCYAYIDDVAIALSDGCEEPSNIEVETGETAATVSWSDIAPIGYQVKLFTERVDEPSTASMGVTKLDTLVFQNSVQIDSLLSATHYYVAVRTVCDTTTTPWKYSEYWSAVTSFDTDCPEKTPLPYTQNFDKLTAGAAAYDFPPCWSSAFDYSGTSRYPYIYSNTTYANSGSNSLYMYSTTSCGSYAALPRFDVDSVQNLAMSFNLYCSNNSYELYVGVMTDPLDIATFTVVDTVTVTTTGKTIGYSVSFDGYKGTGNYLAFSTIKNPTTLNVFYIDDVEVNSQMCMKPNGLDAVNVIDTAATVAWNGKSVESRWQLVVSTNMLDLAKLTSATVGTDGVVFAGQVEALYNAYTVGGLTLQTAYYWYVKPICASETEWSEAGSFTTACKTITPGTFITETFDTYRTTTTNGTADYGLIPDCWFGDNVKASPTASYLPYIYYSTTYSNSGNYCLRLYGYYSSTATSNQTPSWVAMPEMASSVDMSMVVVNFYTYCTTAYPIIVGVMDDPEDISTFTVVDSITLTKSTKELHEVALETYTGTGRYIAFRTRYGATSTVFLDDISLSSASCSAPTLTASKITDTTARLSWSAKTGSKWQVYVTNIDASDSINIDAVPVDSTIVYSDTITTRRVNLDSLDESTTYYVYVRTLCGDDGYSAWRGTSFTTLCKAASIPFVANFDEKPATTAVATSYQPDCWIVGCKNSTSKTYIPWVYNSATYAKTGSNSLRIYGYATYDGAYAITPILAVDSMKNYQARFFAASGSSSAIYRLIVGVVTDPADLATFTAMDTITLPKSTTPDVYVVPFNRYVGDYNDEQGKHVGFMAEFAATNTVYIDSVVVEEIPACDYPVLQADSVGATSATLSWSSSGNAWRVRLLNTEVTRTAMMDGYAGTCLLDTIVASDSYVFENLQASTSYYAYVQTVCDSSTTGIAAKCSFTTICPEAYHLPYKVNFDEMTAGSGYAPSCWTVYNEKSTAATYIPYVYNNTTYANSGSNSLRLYSAASASAPAVAVTPLLDYDLSKAMISFSGCVTTANNSVIVGISENPIADSTFVAIDTIVFTTASAHTPVSILFDTYTGNGQYVVFKTPEAANTVYIDDIIIEKIPTCYMPLNVTVDSISKTAAYVTWNPALLDTLQNAWDVQYGLKGFDVENNAGTIVSTDTTVLWLTGLTACRKYDVYVRTNCGGGDASEWTDVTSFQSLQTPQLTYPYVVDFENDSISDIWTILNLDANGWAIGTADKRSGEKSLYISSDGGQSADYNITRQSSVWAYRLLNLTEGMYAFSFDWKAYGESTHDFMHVGLLPEGDTFKANSTAGVVTDADGTTTTISATALPTNWISLADGVKLNLSSTWQSQLTELPITAEMAGNYKLVFYWCNDGSLGTTPAATVDNIQVKPFACPSVLNVAVAPMDNTVTATWTPAADGCTKWNVLLLTKAISTDSLAAGYVVPDNIVAGSATETTVTTWTSADTLQTSTTYYFYIQTVCDSENGLWKRYEVTTACRRIAADYYNELLLSDKT